MPRRALLAHAGAALAPLWILLLLAACVQASATEALAAADAAPMPPAPVDAPAAAASLPAAAAGPMPPKPRHLKLPAPATPRNADELQLQFAQRLVAAHPDGSYTTPVPARLLAIPVLEVELNANGSVRAIKVLRKPSTGNQATLLATAAVRRAAPYGNVSRLPRPWKLVEVFLFDDELRFKPRTLDTD